MTDRTELEPCVEALLNYQQADPDGIMVLVSRQAIHETVDLLNTRKPDAKTVEAAALEKVVVWLGDPDGVGDSFYIPHIKALFDPEGSTALAERERAAKVEGMREVLTWHPRETAPKTGDWFEAKLLGDFAEGQPFLPQALRWGGDGWEVVHQGGTVIEINFDVWRPFPDEALIATKEKD